MGFENAAMCFYDDPDLIEEMMEHLTNLTLTVIERAVKEVKLDFAAMWEDMAFNNGPMISPTLFRRFMVPRYKRITAFLKQHGIDVVYLDCDGNINQLVEGWLEAGVNCMFPVEVRAGTDPVELRRRYGRQCLLMGGVDKMRLREGRAAIRKEIARIENLVADGGYIPHVDHRCPPDVPYQDYLYYLEVKRAAFGIPTPERGKKWAKNREEG
jgi:uroporphyrinogen decarboxylase